MAEKRVHLRFVFSSLSVVCATGTIYCYIVSWKQNKTLDIIVLKGHWRCLFLFLFCLRVLDKAECSAFESTLTLLSYRIV